MWKLHAKNSAQAWRKFCTLYFNVLKPARKDYRVRTIPDDNPPPPALELKLFAISTK